MLNTPTKLAFLLADPLVEVLMILPGKLQIYEPWKLSWFAISAFRLRNFARFSKAREYIGRNCPLFHPFVSSLLEYGLQKI